MFKLKGTFWLKVLAGLFGIFCLLVVGGATYGYILYQTMTTDLPDHAKLKSYKPTATSYVYDAEGNKISRFRREHRIPISIDKVPTQVKQAFLAAEDGSFYTHGGYDVARIAKAALTNIQNMGTGRRPLGASTITQQVVKNLLLDDEVSLERKFRELVLAIRLEEELTKDQILELYLNEIYFGQGAYGIMAASQNYFGKEPKDLTLEEAAYLAGLPKGPNNYGPDTKRGLVRRNWVIDRMVFEGFITEKTAAEAKVKPIITAELENEGYPEAGYFVDDVRRFVTAKFGEDLLFEGGLRIYTTLNPRMQKTASKVLAKHLIEYDRRFSGYRGPVAHFESISTWQEDLLKVEEPKGLKPWDLAVVLDNKADAKIGLANGTEGVIKVSTMKWARLENEKGRIVGPSVSRASATLKVGDVVMVGTTKEAGVYTLEQFPKLSGAMAVVDPQTGKVLAMAGGFRYSYSEFNRASLAERQPGSTFKPFVYLTGLEHGIGENDIISDGPISIKVGTKMWSPHNYGGGSGGPAPFREGLIRSKNLMTVRIAQMSGFADVLRTAADFGVLSHDLTPWPAYTLGTAETTPLKLTTGYAQIANGGYKITPQVVSKIETMDGKVIYEADFGKGPQLASSYSVETLKNILFDAVEKGTGTRAKIEGYHISGKTGTTNGPKDVWFIGFTDDMVVGTYLGYDEPAIIPGKATGGALVAPMFKQYVEGLRFEDFEGGEFRIVAATPKPPVPDNFDQIVEDDSILVTNIPPEITVRYGDRVEVYRFDDNKYRVTSDGATFKTLEQLIAEVGKNSDAILSVEVPENSTFTLPQYVLDEVDQNNNTLPVEEIIDGDNEINMTPEEAEAPIRVESDSDRLNREQLEKIQQRQPRPAQVEVVPSRTPVPEVVVPQPRRIVPEVRRIMPVEPREQVVEPRRVISVQPAPRAVRRQEPVASQPAPRKVVVQGREQPQVVRPRPVQPTPPVAVERRVTPAPVAPPVVRQQSPQPRPQVAPQPPVRAPSGGTLDDYSRPVQQYQP